MYQFRSIDSTIRSSHILLALFLGGCALAAVVIGIFPLQMSIVTIFLFAGVHNWMEFRYFAARMPLRWSRSRNYYVVGIAGVLILSTAYLSLYFSSGNWLWSSDTWSILSSSWNTAFVMWLMLLVVMRGRLRSAKTSWAVPAACLLAAIAWMVPQYWSLSLVYIHPLVAMWFLDRQIRRSKPEWSTAYRYCLASVPVFLMGIWMVLWQQPDVAEDSNLFWRISQHAGSQILRGISSHLLIATHVFLESIHYFVWILLIPMVDRRAIPWRLESIPLFANSNGWRKTVTAALAFGGVVVVVLWIGFSTDYVLTRDVYFAFAIGHVLAEFPFLIKSV